MYAINEIKRGNQLQEFYIWNVSESCIKRKIKKITSAYFEFKLQQTAFYPQRKEETTTKKYE